MLHTRSRRFIIRESAAIVAATLLGSVQASAQEATPPVDPTAVALEREKLRLEVAKLEQETIRLREQNERPLVDWLRNNALVISGGAVGFFGVVRWFAEQRKVRDERAEDRLATLVDRLASSDEMTRINAAHNLHTFLQPGYKRFYVQILHLVATHLRLQPEPTGKHLPPFTQELVNVFIDAYPRSRAIRGAWRDQSLRKLPVSYVNGNRPAEPSDLRVWKLAAKTLGSPLDLSDVQLPGANLLRADLSNIWMPGANLSKADLRGADLTGAYLRDVDFSGAFLSGADLRWATLDDADLTLATLNEADLRGAYFRKASLHQVQIFKADIQGAHFEGAEICRPMGLSSEQEQMIAEQGVVIHAGFCKRERVATAQDTR
jgi:hypothetical protein